MFKKRLLYFLLLSSLVGCDCFTVVEGRVISNETKLPITDATIELVGKNTTVQSDSNGQFKIKYVSGFCFDPKIRVISDNNKPFELTIHHSKHSRAFEVKSDTKFIEFEKPFYPDSSNDNWYITGTGINGFSQDFGISNDSLLIYLDENDIKKEIENIQKSMMNSY